MTSKINPQRGEIWVVDFSKGNTSIEDEDYALAKERVGSEIMKRRPALIVSIDSFSSFDICTVIPITTWKHWHNDNLWFLVVNPSNQNGLTKSSSATVGQIQTVSYSRFGKHIGEIEENTLTEICAAIAAGIQYECP